MSSLKLIDLFTLVIFITFLTTEADLDDDLSTYLCSPDNQTTPNSAYHSNVKRLLSYLSSNATAKKQFYNTRVSSANQSDSVCGMFGCWSNVPTELCSKCVANITGNILSDWYSSFNCSLSTNAWFIGDRCVIRYSNCSSFSTPDLSSPTGWCASSDMSNNPNFVRLLSETIKEVADEAANSGSGTKNYGPKEKRIAGYQSLYCEAKCTPDLSPLDCTKCLNLTTTEAQQFCPQGLVTMQNPSCSVRCDVYPFFRPVDVLASNGDSQNTTYLSHNCSKTKTINSTTNLMTLLSSLSSSSANQVGFFKTTVHGRKMSDSDPVSGLFMCRGDVSHALCHSCVVNAIKRISLECPSSKEAIIWYDECLVRYSDGKSLSTLDTSPAYYEFVNTPNPNQQQRVLRYILLNTLSGLSSNIGDGSIKNYATKATKLNDHQTLYSLAQCTPDLSYSDCSSCLQNIYNDKEIPWCCMGSPQGKVLYPSCYIMFGLSPFYSDDNQVEANRQGSNTPPAIPENNKNRAKQTIIILIVVFVIVSAILLSFCCYLRRRKARKVNYKALLRKNFGQESITLEGLQFDLSVVKAATNNFSRQNKIGKGGFGEVYKGILSNGRYIAVKRLSTSSKQGSVEFENEVLLIAKLQHRNLVTLIGFCLEDQEQILIYEYMPNGSLDHLLFGTQQQKLHWSERYQIISGTALGILYLHEYSRLKVIHRDLKPSNVLLDENMNPKISDFGMARIVDINKDHGNTNRIAGTYGYMSPEYAMLGQFSEKSDIFSFGVMVLEIVTGKRNVNFYESNSVVEGLIGYVWRRWKNQEALSILDSHIKENYAQMEVMKCIHIGLLCVQEIPSVRPTMTTIISYLNNHSLELPSPQEPAFLMHSRIMDQEIGTHQESSSNQAENGFKMFSINEMSTSSVYPR